MINQDTDQRTIEWMRQRWGHFTGSKVSVLMGKGRKKDQIFSTTAMSYIYQVAGERSFNPEFLSDDDLVEDYINATEAHSKAMQWGIDNEASARSLAANILDKEIIEVSTCKHDTIPFFAASPDGIIRDFDGAGHFGIIEIKCPSVGTFMQYATEVKDGASLKEVKPEYYWQMQAEMDCTGSVGGVFVIYSPVLSEPIKIIHIERNDEDIKLMEERVKLANQYIDEHIIIKDNNKENK